MGTGGGSSPGKSEGSIAKKSPNKLGQKQSGIHQKTDTGGGSSAGKSEGNSAKKRLHQISSPINRKKADNFLNCHTMRYEPTMTTDEK